MIKSTAVTIVNGLQGELFAISDVMLRLKAGIAMASSLLMIAVLVFSIRGFFLGFVGVIGKAIGLVLGYVIAISYRAEAASWVLDNSTLNLPAMVVEIGCGAALFFVTLLTTGFAVSASASLLKKIIPPLQPILDKESTAGKITGALSNGALAAAMVLIGIWVYSSVSKTNVEPPYLQHVANALGDRLFNAVKLNIKQQDMNQIGDDFSLPELTSSNLTSKIFNASSSSQIANEQTVTGSAVIVSESDPDKRLAIKSDYQQLVVNQENGHNSSLLKLLDNEQIKALLNNPQMQKFAMEQWQNSPQQLTALSEKTGLSPEQLQQLLEKLPVQP